jgi:hypothetical protein
MLWGATWCGEWIEKISLHGHIYLQERRVDSPTEDHEDACGVLRRHVPGRLSDVLAKLHTPDRGQI